MRLIRSSRAPGSNERIAEITRFVVYVVAALIAARIFGVSLLLAVLIGFVAALAVDEIVRRAIGARRTPN